MALALAAGVFDDVGLISDVVELEVANGAVDVYTPSANVRGVMFQNTGDSECWFGSPTTIDPDTASNRRGIILLPRQTLLFRSIKSTFSIGFECASGLTTTIGIMEYI